MSTRVSKKEICFYRANRSDNSLRRIRRDWIFISNSRVTLGDLFRWEFASARSLWLFFFKSIRMITDITSVFFSILAAIFFHVSNFFRCRYDDYYIRIHFVAAAMIVLWLKQYVKKWRRNDSRYRVIYNDTFRLCEFLLTTVVIFSWSKLHVCQNV